MSSLTISMIVCVDCQPCSSIVGLNTRTRALAGLALAREVPVRQRRAVQVGRLPLEQVFGIDLAVVARDECLAASRAARGATLAPTQLGDFVEPLALTLRRIVHDLPAGVRLVLVSATISRDGGDSACLVLSRYDFTPA